MAKIIRLTAKNGTIKEVPLGARIKLDPQFIGAKVEMIDSASGVRVPAVKSHVVGKDIVLTYVEDGKEQQVAVEGAAPADTSAAQSSTSDQASNDASAQPAAPAPAAASTDDDSDHRAGGGLSGGAIGLGFVGLGALGGLVAAAGGGGGGGGGSTPAPTDTTAPTATISLSDTALAVGETATVTITFSEAVSGFTNADLVVQGGTLSNVASSDGGRTWTATFTPEVGLSDATNVITLSTGYTDVAGNAGTAATSANYAIDTLTFTVTQTGNTLSFGGTATGPITITLDAANQAIFSRSGETASTIVEAISTKVLDVPQNGTLNLVLDPGATADTFTVNAPNAATINVTGNGGLESDTLAIIVESATGGPDLRTMTLNTSGLTGVEAIKFVFPDDARDVVKLTADSVLTGFSTIEVSKGGVDLTAVTVTPGTEFIVNSTLIVTLDQFKAMTSLVSVTGLGHLTINLTPGEVLSGALNAFLTDPNTDKPILIGTTVTVINTGNSQTVLTPPAMDAISFEGIPGLSAAIDDLQAQIDALGDGGSAAILSITNQLSTLSDALDALSDDFSTHSLAESQALSDLQDALDAANADLGGRIDDLTTALNTEIADLQDQIDANADDITALTARVTTLEDALAALSDLVTEGSTSQAEALADAKAALEEAIADLTAAVALDIADLQGQIDANGADISDLADRATALENALDALTATVSDNDAAQAEALADAKAALETAIADLTDSVAADIADLQAQIDAINDDATLDDPATLNSIAGLRAALEALQTAVGDSSVFDQIADAIGHESDPEANPPVAATGLFADIERLIGIATDDINARIDQLVDDSANDAPATLDSIAGLRSALEGVLSGEGLGDPTDPNSLAGKLADMLDRIDTLENGLDTTAPHVVEALFVSAEGGDINGDLNAGDTVTLSVKFSEAVLVTGNPVLQLIIGDGAPPETVEATLTGGAGTDTLTFTYTITDSQFDATGITIAEDGVVGGTITDAAGNAVVRTMDAVDNGWNVDNNPLDLTMSAGAIFGSGMNADNVAIGWLVGENIYQNYGPVLVSMLDEDGLFSVPEGVQYLTIDAYMALFMYNIQPDSIVWPGRASFDFTNQVAWNVGQFFVVSSEEAMMDYLSSPDYGPYVLQVMGYDSIEQYLAEATISANDVIYNDGLTAGETLSDYLVQAIAGHDAGDVILNITTPLTVAQAAKLAAAGFDLAHNVTYTIRDFDTTVQAAMLNPETATSVREATQVIATGDELANFMRFTSFNASVDLRIEAMAGDDRIDTGRGDEEIVGGLGGDTMNLTFNDTSHDAVIYQTAFDGRTLPVVTVAFTTDQDYYREGTTLRLTINGHTYSYTIGFGGETVVEALASFADAIGNAGGLLSDVRVEYTDTYGDLTSAKLVVYGATPTTALTVESGAYSDDGVLDISNPGMVTLIDVDFPGSSSDYPATTNPGNTTEFSRQISITIEGVTVWADVVEGEPHDSVVALANAINAARLEDTTDGETLRNAIAAINTTDDISGSTLTLHGAAVPDTGTGPTFSVDGASVDVAGAQQETEVTFSSDNADYYAGGKLSVTIDGHVIEADMVAGDAAASQQNLVDAINEAAHGVIGPDAAEIVVPTVLNGMPFNFPATGVSFSNFIVQVDSGGSFVASFDSSNYPSGTFTGATAVNDFIAAVNADLAGYGIASIDADGSFVVTTVELGADAHVSMHGWAMTTNNGSGVALIGNFFDSSLSYEDTGGLVQISPADPSIAALVEDAELHIQAINPVYEGLDFVGWFAPGGGTTRDLNEVAFNEKLASYGEFTMPFVKLNDFIIANSSYDVSGYPNAAVAIVDTVYTSIADWAADASAQFSLITGQSITVSYDPSNGNISFGGFGYPYNFSGGTFAFAQYERSIVITAATEEPDPLGATAALDYRGELQHATIELNDNTQYASYADGTDTGRHGNVYYSGGKAYLTVSAVDANGDPDLTHSTTVSVDMVPGGSITYVMDGSGPVIGADWPMVTPWGNDAGFTITFTVDGVVYDRADLEAYLADQSKFVGNVDTYDEPGAATAGDIANWISSLPGVGTAIVEGKGWTITPDAGHEISISTTGFGLDNGAYYYGFSQQAGPSAEQLTSQALVDAINDAIANAERVPTLTLQGDFALTDAISPTDGRVFGFNVDDDGDGDADRAFQLFKTGSWLASYSYYSGGLSSGSSNPLGTGSMPTTLGALLTRIEALAFVDTATINASGDIVLTFVSDAGVTLSNISQIDLPQLNLVGASAFDQTDFSASMVSSDPVLDLVSNASYNAQNGEITLTAAQYGKETFEVSDITLDYQGVKQLATITLDSDATYGETFIDGGTVDDATYGRGAQVYYEGGKAYLTITPTGGEAITVSADMVADDAAATSQALVDAINAETGVSGLLEGVIGVATRDGNTITLEAAQYGHETFTVSDVALDYQGTNQIATADYSTNDWEYYAGGTLSVTVDTTPDLDDGTDGDVTISVAMVDGDADASITALHDAILGKITQTGGLTMTVPAIFAAPGSFDLTDPLYLSSQRVFGISIDTDGDGTVDHGVSLSIYSNTINAFFYYSGGVGSGFSGSGSGSSYGLGSFAVPQTIGELLTRIAGLPFIDTATIDADGDIVLTFTGEGGIHLTPSATLSGGTFIMGEGYASLGDLELIYGTGANLDYDPRLAAVLSDVTLDGSGTITLTSKDHTEQQFTITDATITEAPTYQESTARFSDNDADYYAGGKIGIDVNGTTIEVDMVPGDAALTVANLVNAIEAANRVQIVVDQLADLMVNDLLSNGWQVSSGGITIDANTAGINNGNDVQALLQALEMLPDVDSAVIVDGNIVVTAKTGVDALTIGVTETDLGIGGEYVAPTTLLSGDLQDVWSNGSTTITLMAAHDVDGYGEINITDVHMGVAAQVQVTEIDLGDVDFEVGRVASNLPDNTLSVGGQTIVAASGSTDADSVRNLAQAIIEARDGVIAEDTSETTIGTAPGNDLVITVDTDFVADFDMLVSGGFPSSSYMSANLAFVDGNDNHFYFGAFVTPFETWVDAVGWTAGLLTTFTFAGYVDALNNALTTYEDSLLPDADRVELGTISYNAVSHQITFDVADGYSAQLSPQATLFSAQGDNGEDSSQITVDAQGGVTGMFNYTASSNYDSTTLAVNQGVSTTPALVLSLFSENEIKATDSLTSDKVTGTLVINGETVEVSFTPLLDEVGIGSGSKISDLVSSLSAQLTGVATVELINGQIMIVPVLPETGLPTITGSVTFAVEDASVAYSGAGFQAAGLEGVAATLTLGQFAGLEAGDRLVDGHYDYSFYYTEGGNQIHLSGALDAAANTVGNFIHALEINFPQFTVALTAEGIVLTTVAQGADINLAVDQLGFDVYRSSAGVLSNVVSIVDYNENMGITLTGANAGYDQMLVGGFGYDVEDAANSVKQEVVVTFNNAVLDAVGVGTVVSVRVAGITSSYTVIQADVDLPASSQSETIVQHLAAQVLLDHANSGSALGVVEQGRLSYDTDGNPVFTPTDPANSVNANMLHFTASATGADLLGVATDDTSIFVSIEYPNHTFEGQPGLSLEMVEGKLLFTDGTDPDHIYAYTGQTEVSHTGRVEGVLHFDENWGNDGEVHSNDYTLVDVNGEDMSIFVDDGGVIGEFDVSRFWGVEGIISADDQWTEGDSEDSLTQGIVNPDDNSDFYGDSPLSGTGEDGSLLGVDQAITNPGDDSDYYGDNASTGATGGVEQTHTNPDNGYLANNVTPAAAGGEDSSGNSDMYGSNAGQYEDDGLHTTWMNNGASADGLVWTERFGNSLTDQVDLNNRLSGAYETGEDGSSDVTRDGYAAFSWDNAIRNVQSTGNATWDVINHFQVGHDVIALEGVLQNTTTDGNVDWIDAADVTTYPTINWTGFGAYIGEGAAASGGGGTMVGVEWNFAHGDANVPFTILNGSTRQTLTLRQNGGDLASIQFGLSFNNATYDSVDDFMQALNASKTLVSGDISDPLVQAAMQLSLTGSLADGRLSISAPNAPDGTTLGFWDSAALTNFNAYLNGFMVEPAGFDLSTNEFGLVGSALNGEQGSDQLDTITLANYGGGTDVVSSDDYSIGRSSVTISVDGGLTTHTYRIGTLETIQDLVDSINEGGLVHAAIGENGSAPFTLTETVVGQELTATFNLNMAWDTGGLNWSVMAGDHSTVSTGQQTDVLVSELTDAQAITDLLNTTFDFGNTVDNGEINTSIFAVTAADDDTQTAIWAHRQSWSGDNTIDALELTLLGVVHTTGGEFSLDNLAMMNQLNQPI